MGNHKLLGLGAFVLLPFLARCQKPFDGLSKTTYTASTPFVGLDFNLKYFPVYDMADSCYNDQCNCTLNGTFYYIDEGRVQLAINNDTISSSTSQSQQTTVLGGYDLPTTDDGFGLHLINCSTNIQPDGMTTLEVEEEFASKLGDMDTYDGFMDYNVAMLTTNLDKYITKFERDGIPFLPLTWLDQNIRYYGIIVNVPSTQMIIEIMAKADNNDNDNNDTLFEDYSTTKTTTEKKKKNTLLVSKHPKLLTLDHEGPRVSHQALIGATERLTQKMSKMMKPNENYDDYFELISIGRAASELDKINEFYGNGMKATNTLTYISELVNKTCYIWPGSNHSTCDVCFTQRTNASTKGDFKVLDFENMLFQVHENIIANRDVRGNCNNKWIDNHYAVDNEQGVGHNFDYMVDYVAASDTYFYCDTGNGTAPGAIGQGIHYIVDPTGWGIQLVFNLTYAAKYKLCPEPPPTPAPTVALVTPQVSLPSSSSSSSTSLSSSSTLTSSEFLSSFQSSSSLSKPQTSPGGWCFCTSMGYCGKGEN